jgi:hypothetical protein
MLFSYSQKPKRAHVLNGLFSDASVNLSNFWGQYTFGAFFFLPQHNGKTQSCSEAKASSAAKNHTPDDGKYTISLYILVFMTIG